jgi:uncharacterized surface anchored protein
MLLRLRSKKWIANLTVVLMILTLIPAAAFAATSTTWSQAGYDNVSETWTPGNLVKYYEGSYVPYRANAEGYVPTGQVIEVDLDYYESNTGALGYDGATGWFIGPYVPYSGSPTLYTKADINAYAQATYGHSIIEPDTQFMGADAFTVNDPVELTSGGLTMPAGYDGDTLLRYHLNLNELGYTTGDTSADPGSFIDALMTWYGGDWTIYYTAHLAESGAPNLFEGGTVVLGAGAYAGSSLHVTFSQTGEKSIPLPTNGLAKKDFFVEKNWSNINDAEPVTIKLIGQNGETGTPYVAATITLDGTVDTNANPEYEAWKGKFVNLPIYYTVGKDIFPIIYSVVEDPVPTGFLDPVYGGSAADFFTVYNEKIYGSLTVHKTVNTNDAIGLTVPDFSITITGPSYPTGNTKVFNQTNGMEQTWTNLLPGTYTVTESGISAPWSVDIDPETFDVEGGDDTDVDVTVTNSYAPGSLTVHKTVDTNDAVGLTVPDFSITITGPSYPTGDTKVFNQTNGMEQTWENLIPGNYTVTESGIAAPWSVDIDPEDFDVLSGEDTTVDVTVTNSYDVGSLTVLKAVETNGAIGLTVPDFSITITGPSYPDGDTKVFNQTNGMEQTWENLIPGTYTVTESGIATPWSVVIDPEEFDVVGGEDTTVDVTVTNTYATGSLTVLKSLELNGAIGLDVPDFSITITGPSYPSGDTKVFNETIGMEQTWTNLIPGTYTVTEPGVAEPWSVVIDPTTYQVLSGEDTTVDVVVTNTYTPGSLTVEKVVDTNDAVGLTIPDFSITITGPSYPTGDTKVFNETNGMEQTWDNLIPGTYTVTESGIDDPWSVVIDPEEFDVESGEDTTVDVTVTNTFTPGSLTVLKAVETNGAIGLTVPDFSITITGPSYPTGDTKIFNQTNGMEQTWDNLIPGTYTVTESGIAAPWSVVIDPEEFDVESGADTEVDVTVTNTYATGSLTVLKSLQLNGAIGLETPDFNITITGPSYPSGDTKVFNSTIGMEQTWTNLIPGTYTVTESGIEDPWSVVIDPEEFDVLSGENTTVDVTVTNTYTPGSLTVLKTVDTNDTVGLDIPDFSITITGPSYPTGDTKVFNQTNGMEQTWDNLIPGTYTVTESGIDDPWSVVIDPETFDVESGEDTTVDVTVANTYTPGSLTVLKDVETNDAVGLDVPDFSISITGPSYPTGDTKVFNQTNGMEQTWDNLIPGTYTVTESGIEEPWSVVIDPETFDVESGEDTTVDVTVTNTYAPGSLTVLKAVETNGAIGLTVPDFSITITGPSYPTGDTKIFNQTNGMEQTWDNLIPGTYTVTESGIEAPWSVVIDPEEFDVESGQDTTVDVTVTNTFATGSLTVLKSLEMNGVVGLSLEDFSITITGPSYPSGDTKVFNETIGMEQTWTNLIPGTYTVTEPGVEAPWSVVIDPEEYEVLSGEDTTVDVVVTNTYTPGSLTVLKVVDTNDAIGLTIPDFSITITGPSYPSGDTKVFNETNGMEQTWNGLIPGTYTVTEPGIEAPWSVVIDPATYEVASGEDTTVDVTVTNTYTPGTITVTKEVVILTEDPTITVNYTFYAALFEEEEDTMVRVSDVKELQVIDSQSTSVVFEGLVADKTYYVFETDSEGNIIQTNDDGTIVTPIIPDWTKISYENGIITLTPSEMEGEATITNVFEPQDFPLYGSITVNKQVTVNGKAYASNRTFYVALFADKELTELVSEVRPLKMNGMTSTTTEFLTDLEGNPLEAGTTYFIAETDKNGVPLKGTVEELGFEISIDKSEVVIVEEGTTVNIINKFKSEEFPLTGDDFNLGFWLYLAMLGVAGVIAPFAFRRKEDTN